MDEPRAIELVEMVYSREKVTLVLGQRTSRTFCGARQSSGSKPSFST
jgi:hypothetical protein